MSSLAARLPRPLSDDILHGRWLPVVGAGISRNASVPYGHAPRDWNGLAAALKAELSEPDDAVDAIDIISAYAQDNGRPALIERVARETRLADALPGALHRSLCRLPLDLLVTTNFDPLLEYAFREVHKPCYTVLDESQLAITNPYPGPMLLKIHGDFSRPDKMVLTEDDFDRFLLRNPLLATVVASHFAQRSVVLLGYSLSDPDLRQLLALVRERLGDGARAIYALEVDAPTSKIARFERRHVRVVSLPGDRRNPEPTLRELFEDLFKAGGRESLTTLAPRSHEAGMALRATRHERRGCFLSAAPDRYAEYLEWLSPVLSRLGVPLLTPFDFISINNAIPSAVDSMIASAGAAIIEASSANTAWEIGTALNRLGADRVLILTTQRDEPLISDLAGVLTYPAPTMPQQWDAFAEYVARWLPPGEGSRASEPGQPGPPDDTLSRIMREAIQLERALGDLLGLPEQQRSLSRLIRAARDREIITGLDFELLESFVGLRNRVAHGRASDMSSASQASLLDKVQEILVQINSINR